MRLIIINGEGEKVAPEVGESFTCEIMPIAGQQIVFSEQDGPQTISKVGFTVEQQTVTPTIWLAGEPQMWVG